MSMIYIDASEGVAGDMLLAAMIGLFEPGQREDIVGRISRAADNQGLSFALHSIEDVGDVGLAISYQHSEPGIWGTSYDECFALLTKVESDLGSDSEFGGTILRQVFDAESAAHGVPPEQVHLHEIGRPQAMLNIAGIGLAASKLLEAGTQEFVCSTITTGSGIVVVSHGAVRVPAPASERLLAGLKHAKGNDPGERATPTGIAAVRTLSRRQSDDLPKTHSRKSIGFGTKRFGGRLGRTTLFWA